MARVIPRRRRTRREVSNAERSFVETRHAFGDGAEGFPRDLVRPAGELGDGNFRGVLPADEHDGIAAADGAGRVGEVDDRLVHADAAEDRAAAAAGPRPIPLTRAPTRATELKS